MIRIIVSLLIVVPVVFFTFAAAGNDQPDSLTEIVENIEDYRGTAVTMQLRLKYLDRVFGKVVFYDKDNIDIEFDISSPREQRRLAGEILNLHRGVYYNVRFMVRDVGALGLVIGDVKSFKPVALDSLP